jgi:hypothetical protein
MRLLGNVNWWWPWPFNRLLPGVVFHGKGKVDKDERQPVATGGE